MENTENNVVPNSNGPTTTTKKNAQSSNSNQAVGLEIAITERIKELENHSNNEEKENKLLAKASKKHIKEMRDFLTETFDNENFSKEEKIKTVLSKYVQLLNDNKILEKEATTKSRRSEQLNKEKDTIYSELTKVNSIKSKLETLCRELQKQNKASQEDSKRMAEEEKVRRSDLSKKFHEKIQEISKKMEEQGEERIKLYKENEVLREKIKNFVEQYEIREKHFETQVKSKDLEIKLLEAKVKQQTQIAASESHRAKTQLQSFEEQSLNSSKTEKELRAQLALYAQKFEQFQETLSKSNDVFNTFKQDMERMARTIKKNEKENTELKKKCEQTDLALIELAEERNSYKTQHDNLKIQKKKLEELCRSLQMERNQLRSDNNLLKEKGQANNTNNLNSDQQQLE